MGNYDSQLWRTEYEQSRYLRHLPDGALDQRISGLQNNLWATDESGRAVRLADGQRRARLWQLLVHATLEKKERESTATVNFDEGRLIASASASYIAPVLKAPMSAFP